MRNILFSKDQGNKKLSIFVAIIIFALCFYSLYFYPTGFNDDDAFFYFSIAYRFVNQGISSFDGLSITNGYHPLWMFFLTTFCLPLKLLGIKSIGVFSVFFSLLVSFVWFLIAKEGSNLFKIIILGLSFRSIYGMETALGSLIIIYLFKFSNSAISKKYFSFINSFLIFLLVLTRIDFVIPVLILFLKKESIKDKVINIYGLLLGISIYFLYNYQLTKHIFTVSSYLKVSSTDILRNIAFNYSSEILLYIFLFNISVFIFYIFSLKILLYKSFLNKTEYQNYIFLALSSQSFILFHSFFSQIRWWYVVPSSLSIIYLLDSLIRNYPILKNKLFQGLSYKNFANGVFFTSSILSLLIFIRFFDDSLKNREFIIKAKEIIDNNQPVYVFDSSGILSWNFMPEINVINGDGLVNSFDYMKNYLRGDESIVNYFRENNINFYINNRTTKCPTIKKDCEDVFKNSESLLSSNAKSSILKFKLYRVDLD